VHHKMGCVQSETHNSHQCAASATEVTNQQDGSSEQVLQVSQTDIAARGLSDNSPGTPARSSPSIFGKKANHLGASQDAFDTLDSEEESLPQKRGIFPLWKTSDKYSVYISSSAVPSGDDEEPDAQELIVKVACMDSVDPRLCRQLSTKMMVRVNSLKHKPDRSQAITVDIANILAVVSL
jgi:hypothetical protein